MLANAALVHHLGNVTVPCQPSGGWLAAVLGTVLSAALHVDGLSTLQGHHYESNDDLADNDAGTGSGWKQNKQNNAVQSMAGCKPK